MQVLNATKRAVSIMTDRGEFISIKPGELSRLIIASRNLIIGAIKLGTPSEIGVILSGSYEFEIAKSITGSTPYLYSDADEAIAKLIDPTVDYKSNINAAKLNLATEEELKEALSEIEKLKAIKSDLESELESIKSGSSEKTIDLERKVKELEGSSIKYQEERDKARSLLAEAQDQVSNLNENLNTTKNEYNSMKGNYDQAQKMIDNLSKEIEDLKAGEQSANESIKQYTDKIQELQNELEEINNAPVEEKSVTDFEEYKELCDENASLKESLKEASENIDSMKSKFNEACKKFRITLDENGEWIQLPE